MREKKATCFEIEMEQMTTEQLDALLQNEIRKDKPDEKVVLSVLKVLAEREQEYPVDDSDQVRSAWERYQECARPQQKACRIGRNWSWIKGVTTAAAILCLLVLAIPFAADADGTLDILYRVTDSIVEFFQPGSRPSDAEGEYIFETDNPGLQQLYDKAVELGVTAPVVPMWLPEGYVLEELKIIQIVGGKKIYARFVNDNQMLMIQIKIVESISSTQYEQEDGAFPYYVSGQKHLLFDNVDYVSAMWAREYIECGINITDDQVTLQKIINSIYRRK